MVGYEPKGFCLYIRKETEKKQDMLMVEAIYLAFSIGRDYYF